MDGEPRNDLASHDIDQVYAELALTAAWHHTRIDYRSRSLDHVALFLEAPTHDEDLEDRRQDVVSDDRTIGLADDLLGSHAVGFEALDAKE